MSRPWFIADENRSCVEPGGLFERWLKERGGVVVYENHVMDSSSLGHLAFMPARYYAEEDNQLHDAPDQYRPNGGAPSMRGEKVDHIKLEEFGGDVDKALRECFHIPVRGIDHITQDERRRGA